MLFIIKVTLSAIFWYGIDAVDLFNSSVRTSKNCQFHLFPPESFDMYTKCLGKQPLDPQYMTDGFFLYTLQAMDASVPPEDANLFVIPALMSLSMEGRCGGQHKKREHMQQAMSIINKKDYSKGHRNHLLVASNWRIFYPEHYPPPFIAVGAFEKGLISWGHKRTEQGDYFTNSTFAVGYSTVTALATYYTLDLTHPSVSTTPLHHQPPIIPYHQRQYLFSFLGNINRANYRFRYRHKLADLMAANPEYANLTDIFVFATESHIIQKGNRIDGEAIMADSIMVLTLPGDTPTTSRIVNAFETLTLVGALTSTKSTLLLELPFHSRVPWEELIVWIDTDAYMINPVQALRETVLNMTQAELSRRQKMMLQYRGEVVWMRPESRVHINILEEACRMNKKM